MKIKLSNLLHALGLTLAMAVAASPVHAQEDPPGRVARLSYSSGNVTFSPAGSEDWIQAQPNRPLTTGDRIWVDSNARSEFHVGSTALRLGHETSMDFLTLNDSMVQLKLVQGALRVDVRGLTASQSFEIDTPNIAFVIQEPGDYRINVAEDGSASTVTIYSGGAIAYGNNERRTLQGRQQLVFSGSNLSRAASSNVLHYDSFDQWVSDRGREEEESVSARYVSREVVGYEQLDTYGTWHEYPEYGSVWIPRGTAAGWSPYSTGHWTWVAPWGWTWVDDAPWGFAPYHYGRWAHVRNRWCWVPGRMTVDVAPVYAPALVAFVGNGHRGFNFGLSLSSGGVPAPGVAWFPLAPGEIYRPSYISSPTYIVNVNRSTYDHHRNTNNTARADSARTVYVNQSVPNAVIAAPAATFVKGEGITPGAHWQDSERFRNLQASTGAPAIAPVAQSVLGAARIAPVPVVASAPQRPVIATTAPAVPPASRDVLAQRFADQQRGVVPGVGPAFGRTQNDGRGAAAPADMEAVRRAAVVTVPAAQAPVSRPSIVGDRREVTGLANSRSEPGNAQPAPSTGAAPANRDRVPMQPTRDPSVTRNTEFVQDMRRVSPAPTPAPTPSARDLREMELRRVYGAQGQGAQETVRPPVFNNQPAVVTAPQPAVTQAPARNYGGQNSQGYQNEMGRTANERPVQVERPQARPQQQMQPQPQPQPQQQMQPQPQQQVQPQQQQQRPAPRSTKLTPEEERERANGANGRRF